MTVPTLYDNVADGDELEQTAVGSRVEVAALARRGKAQRPWLVIVSGNSSIGKMYRLEQRIVLGRSPQCDVRIDGEGVSRRHAVLECTPEGTVRISDLGSRNGTFVNGEQAAQATLRDGDKIQIGTTTILKFSYQDELDEALQSNLYESATRDPLTHVVNRRGFADSLAKEFAFARRHTRALSVVAFDVDHFKRINDTYGHPAGDAVLKRLAEVVGATIRCEDVLARVGGEEFVILLRDIVLQDAVSCAERIRQSVERCMFDVGTTRIALTVSLGVATLQPADPDGSAMLQAADRFLYEAKRAGRNRVCAEPA